MGNSRSTSLKCKKSHVCFFYRLVRRGGLMGAARLRIKWPGLYRLLARHEVKICADIDQLFSICLCVQLHKHKSKNEANIYTIWLNKLGPKKVYYMAQKNITSCGKERIPSRQATVRGKI